MIAYKKVKVQSLSESDKQKRVYKVKKRSRYMAIGKVNKTFFTYEKLFKLHNSRNTLSFRKNVMISA